MLNLTSKPTRLILHADLDCFFAAVAVREDPALRGRPVVVGGSNQRGVVAAANYEARAFGVRSAMPVKTARRLCPQAAYLSPDRRLYSTYSKRFVEVLHQYAPAIETVSLDEAYLDISSSAALFGGPVKLAWLLSNQIKLETGLAASIGIGPSKLVAKLACRAAKPYTNGKAVIPGKGVVFVDHERSLEFLSRHRVAMVGGVGPATESKLSRMGILTLRDLAAAPIESLVRVLGSQGRVLHDLALGRDESPVKPFRNSQSISQEITFAQDVSDQRQMNLELLRLCEAVAFRLRSQSMVAKTVSLKLRLADFQVMSRSRTLSSATDSGGVFAKCVRSMAQGLPWQGGIRLLGVSASHLGHERQVELPMHFGDVSYQPSEGWQKASEAADLVRSKFGQNCIGLASLMPSSDSEDN